MRVTEADGQEAVTGAGDIAAGGSASELETMLEQAVARIAPTDLPILLVGECGTGKTFLARRIHQLSARQDQPFFRMICSGLTPEAVEQHFANGGNGNGTAGKGTLFLKEIGELSSASQRSLLYAIPDGDSEWELGALRLISSTTVDVEEEVAAGRFRSDLFYRLKTYCLHLSPLRKRKEDVPHLAELLLTKHAALQGRPRPNLDAEDFSLLREWNWPGNVRELENVIRQMVILNDAKQVLRELMAAKERVSQRAEHEQAFAANGLALQAATRAASRRVEERLILDALSKTRWNRKRAAQDLKISYKSLLSKLKRIGAEKPGTNGDGNSKG